MSSDWEPKCIRFVILEMLRKKGYSKVEDHALQIMADLILATLKKLMKHTKELSHLSSRSETTLYDLLSTFKKYQVNQYKLIDFIKDKKKKQNSGKGPKHTLSHTVVTALTKRAHFSTRESLGDLSRPTSHGKFKKVKIKSLYPIQMRKEDRERPIRLHLQKPPKFSYQETRSAPVDNMRSSDLKNLKAEEQRIYEIENCKISAIADDSKNEKNPEFEKKHEGGNVFDSGSMVLSDIGIFDISNKQMF